MRILLNKWGDHSFSILFVDLWKFIHYMRKVPDGEISAVSSESWLVWYHPPIPDPHYSWCPWLWYHVIAMSMQDLTTELQTLKRWKNFLDGIVNFKLHSPAHWLLEVGAEADQNIEAPNFCHFDRWFRK